jgi:hypothetical protein
MGGKSHYDTLPSLIVVKKCFISLICFPRDKPSENIFPHQRLCRAGEEIPDQGAPP